MSDEELDTWYRATVQALRNLKTTVTTAGELALYGQHILVEADADGTDTILRLAVGLSADVVVFAPCQDPDDVGILTLIIGNQQVVVHCGPGVLLKEQLPRVPLGPIFHGYGEEYDSESEAIDREVEALPEGERQRLVALFDEAASAMAWVPDKSGQLWEPPEARHRVLGALLPWLNEHYPDDVPALELLAKTSVHSLPWRVKTVVAEEHAKYFEREREAIALALWRTGAFDVRSTKRAIDLKVREMLKAQHGQCVNVGSAMPVVDAVVRLRDEKKMREQKVNQDTLI